MSRRKVFAALMLVVGILFFAIPIVYDYRGKLYAEIVSQYEKAKEQNANKAKEVAQTQATEQAKDQYMKVDGKELPFR